MSRVDDSMQRAMQRGYVAAFRWLGSADESREACQEAARKALGSGRYDASRPFYPWFYRVLRNHCMDRLKRRGREVPLRHEVSAEAEAEEALIRGEREAAVSRAIEGLEGSLREIIELRHFQELSYEEIAAVLECPKGTVMSRLYRARQALRVRLLRDPGFGGTP